MSQSGESLIYHCWAPLEDYRPGEELAVDDLRALGLVWQEQREQLANLDQFRLFEERLRREWAIETGLIERLYTLDRGITQLLIERGIEASTSKDGRDSVPESVTSMIADHKAVVDGLFDFITGERRLSISYIKELHALMTRSQDFVEGKDTLGRTVSTPLAHGEFKKLPNNPVRTDGKLHEYCPPEQVDSEMDRLMDLHHRHVDVAPEVEAAWLHHRFSQIHPFQDGNGRIARALSTLVFIKAGWFPLVVRDRDRDRYLDYLEIADHGDLKPLVEYFARLQREEFIRALRVADEVKREPSVADTIESIRRRLQERQARRKQELEATKVIAERLQLLAEDRLSEVADSLRSQTAGLLPNAWFQVDGESDEGERSHYYRNQLVETAKQLDYFADLNVYRAWTRLVLKASARTEVLISFHGVGQGFRGVLGCSASWFQRVETENGERELSPVTAVSNDLFLVNHKESVESTSSRFLTWLEKAIDMSLNMWSEAEL